MNYCHYCDRELPAGSHPRRLFCNDAHKQAYWRQVHHVDQERAHQAELGALRAQIIEQVQRIEELEEEVSRLKRRLNMEQRFLSDTSAYPFKSWLGTQPCSALAEKLFGSNMLVPVRGSRSLYEGYLRRLGCTEEEQQEFVRLWKLMLLMQP